MNKKIGMLLALLSLFLIGCASTPRPQNPENVCAIFHEYPQWYRAAKKSEAKWGVPVQVQMAIMYYESSFDADARPPKKYLLGFIPNGRISTAYGYAQALDGTWNDYLTEAGSFFARRNKFESATDFIGWYGSQVRQKLGIASTNAYDLYLAYHEGWGGYAKHSYLKKPWLMHLAQKVQARSRLFEHQLFDRTGHSIVKPTYHDEAAPEDIQLEAPSYIANDDANPDAYTVSASSDGDDQS